MLKTETRWAIAVALILTGCATAYQPMGSRGGFSQTRLSDDTFQVRVEANAYSDRDRVSQYILRRCAELTLEHGKRYMILRSPESQTSVGSDGFLGVVSFPSGQAIVKILNAKEDSPDAVDAVVIIKETDAIAEGRLSPEAGKTYRAFLGVKTNAP